MSAVRNYQHYSNSMTEDEIENIIKYYNNWKGQKVVKLQFRFIKLVARTINDAKLKWYYLHGLVNKRRITNDKLPYLIKDVIDKNIIPLRIFHSCTEWLAPNELWKSKSPRIISSGFIPFENDTDLESSIYNANRLLDILVEPTIVYSGNKSIHLWEPLTIKNLSDKELAYADQREIRETKERTSRYSYVRNKVGFDLDRRISTDPRRVVPIINSLNGITQRKVVELDREELSELQASKLKLISQI